MGGRDHAKWSPVCTAWYFQLPEVNIIRIIHGEMAFDMGLRLPGWGKIIEHGFNDCLVLDEVRYHLPLIEKCRSLCMDGYWMSHLKLCKIENHFCFLLEGVGGVAVWDIFLRALSLLDWEFYK